MQDILYDLLKEVKEDIKETNEKLNKSQLLFAEHTAQDAEMSRAIQNLSTSLSENNRILSRLTATVEIHERRSTNIEKLVIGDDHYIGLVKRVDELEEPKKIREYFKNKYFKVTAVLIPALALATGILKIMGKI